MASVGGAETEATMGIPAASAFCTISRDERKQSVEQSAADRFIDGIVTSHILAENNAITLKIEDGGSMDTAGAIEISLRTAETLGQFEQLRDRNAERRHRLK